MAQRGSRNAHGGGVLLKPEPDYVQPVCTNAHVMRPGAPSLTVNGSKEIGRFVVVISSLYIRL